MIKGLATNALKRLMNQLEVKILQTEQLKNALKRLQHFLDHTLKLFMKLANAIALLASRTALVALRP